MAVTELKHMRVVMSLCKLKLYQYHEILSTSIPTDDTKSQQALTGIQEVSVEIQNEFYCINGGYISR